MVYNCRIIVFDHIFTTLDLISGYWQFNMDENSKKYTAFVSHRGLYEFKKLPIGLCCAGSTFQKAMSEMLEDHKNSSAYIDDILTHSKSFDQHLEDLEKVYMCLRKENLKVNTKKCRIGFQETKFLGFIISKDGLKANPDKVQTVKNTRDRIDQRTSVARWCGIPHFCRIFFLCAVKCVREEFYGI